MSPRLSGGVRVAASRKSYDTQNKAAPPSAYEAPGWLPGGIYREDSLGILTGFTPSLKLPGE